MPKMNDRERLADLEARQVKIAADIFEARRALRGKYAGLMCDLEIEKLTEKECRDILAQAIKLGGSAALAVLKSAPAGPFPQTSKRPQGVPATSTA